MDDTSGPRHGFRLRAWRFGGQVSNRFQCGLRRFVHGRQRQREHAALARLARHRHPAAVRLGDAMDEIQAEAAAVNLLRDRLAPAIERLEDVLAIFGIDAESAIFNGEGDRLRLSLIPDP